MQRAAQRLSLLLRDEVGPLGPAPGRHVLDQPLRLSNAVLRSRFVDVIARVIRYVPLPPQGVQHDGSLGIETNGERQSLDNGHVVARSVRIGPVTVHHQGGQRTLHDCLVGSVETRLWADARNARITQISARCNQEPLNFCGLRGVRLKLPDLQ